MTWTDTEHIVSDPVDGELMMRGAEIRASTEAYAAALRTAAAQWDEVSG